MLKNYLTVALRSILRNKLTASINIAGLALALACALLIYLFVTDEVSYETYHSKADRIYRVTRSFHSPQGEVNLHLANVAPPIGPLLKNDFGEIDVVARVINFNTVVGLEENGQLKMVNRERSLFVAEPSIFSIFDIPVISGDGAKALERPFTVMLSEKTAQKYFNSTNIIGKRLRIDNSFDLEVTGVYKDLPLQSHWHPDLMVSFATMENDNVYGRKRLETNWGNNAFGTYLLLHEGSNAQKLEASLPAFLDKHFGNFARANWGAAADFKASETTSLYLQKVTDIHLRSHLDDEVEANGNISTVYMISIIGVFIILIACFNFINLSTARATKRAKEVGLRKVVGAFKSQLVGQYLSESVLMAGLALVLGLAIASVGLNWLNDFTGKNLSLQLWNNIPLSFGLVGATVFIGILAGIYPAFIISSFKPAQTLKSQQASTGKGGIRKVLVVLQFSISIALIIGTMITFQQLSFLNNQNLGYQKDQVVTLTYYDELAESYEPFFHALTQSTTIEKVGRSSRIPTGRLLDSYGDAKVQQGDSVVSMDVNLKSISVDDAFFDAYGITMAAGRNFSREIKTDDSLAFIVNETAAKAFGWTPQEGVGKEFQYGGVNGKLVGVVKDFHFESLHQTIVPMVFLQRDNNFGKLSIKISGTNFQEGIAHLEKTWKAFLPARPFDYDFLSQKYQSLYDAEQKQSQLFTTFSILAIFIASLGLFGLATFSTLQRMKEIGIRKILGASAGSILQLLSKEILLLIVIANLIAWPTAWYLMSLWLDGFAYKTDMSVFTYIGAAVCALSIALVTVSTQTLKAALSNPAKTLRHE